MTSIPIPTTPQSPTAKTQPPGRTMADKTAGEARPPSDTITATSASASASASAGTTISLSVEIKPAPIENIPPEIRRNLLELLGLEQLEALVHASPVYHQQYLVERRRFLRQCLLNSLGSVVVDAYTAQRVRMATTKPDPYKFICTVIRGRFRHDVGKVGIVRFLYDNIDDATLTPMARYYLEIISPLFKRYCAWASAYLAAQAETSETSLTSLSHENLTVTERARVMRAFYRYQICCMGLTGMFQDGTRTPSLNRYFEAMEPWEAEEIICVYAFAVARYDEILDDLHWELHYTSPKFGNIGRPNRDYAFDLDYNRESLLEGIASRGLHSLLHVMTDDEQGDREGLVKRMQSLLKQSPPRSFVENEALVEPMPSTRGTSNLTPRDWRQRRREPLPFAGDIEASFEDEIQPDDTDPGHILSPEQEVEAEANLFPQARPLSERPPPAPAASNDATPSLPQQVLRPPLAWTILWKGTYSSLLGYYLPSMCRRWGYVMWDAARIEATGARALLLRQWDERWGEGRDPREYLIRSRG